MAITRRVTPAEFLSLPEEKPALELIDGMVVQKVSPQEQHGALQSMFAGLVNVVAVPRKLAMAITELRGTFGPDVLVPDVAIYRWERLPRTADGELANVYERPPDVAIEIVSPEQTLREMVEKCRRFVANGVERAFAVDPRTRSVVLVGPDGAATTLRGEDLIDLGDVVPGFELSVGELLGILQLD